MNDPSPDVRATAVHGVFHIVTLFWEVIPAHVVKELVSKIVSHERNSIELFCNLVVRTLGRNEMENFSTIKADDTDEI